VPPHELADHITGLRREMMEAAEKLDYERAAELRDRIKRMERKVFGLDAAVFRPPQPPPGSAGTHAGDRGRGRLERHKVKELGNTVPMAKSRGRKGAGAATGAAAGAAGSNSRSPGRQGRLKLIPDRPE